MMQSNKKAQGMWRLIVGAAVTVFLVIVIFWFINTYLVKRGPEAVEKVGFGPLEDADNDGIQNFQDTCCAAVCDPRGVPVARFGEYRGCTAQQGATPCNFNGPKCNPRSAAQPPQGTPVAGAPPSPQG